MALDSLLRCNCHKRSPQNAPSRTWHQLLEALFVALNASTTAACHLPCHLGSTATQGGQDKQTRSRAIAVACFKAYDEVMHASLQV